MSKVSLTHGLSEVNGYEFVFRAGDKASTFTLATDILDRQIAMGDAARIIGNGIKDTLAMLSTSPVDSEIIDLEVAATEPPTVPRPSDPPAEAFRDPNEPSKGTD